MRWLKLWQIILLILGVLLLAGAGGFIIWASNPLPADPRVQSFLEDGSSVAVDNHPWLVFRPQSGDPSSGLIFYPGGRVQPQAYLPAAYAIAGAGHLVVIPPMPLNLAVFGSGVASQVMSAFPKIDCWVIGGHSLGGAMAARFAYQNPQAVQGLVLWAAYPASSNDLSSSDLEVVSIYASQDGLADVATILASQSMLPEGTKFVRIEGGNHAGFGWYGPQPGDNPRTISLETQQEQVIHATIDLLTTACP